MRISIPTFLTVMNHKAIKRFLIRTNGWKTSTSLNDLREESAQFHKRQRLMHVHVMRSFTLPPFWPELLSLTIITSPRSIFEISWLRVKNQLVGDFIPTSTTTGCPYTASCYRIRYYVSTISVMLSFTHAHENVASPNKPLHPKVYLQSGLYITQKVSSPAK